jgi:hypothetical protein
VVSGATRYVVRAGDGWTVGCAFVGLTTKKQEKLRALLFELSLPRSTPSALLARSARSS